MSDKEWTQDTPKEPGLYFMKSGDLTTIGPVTISVNGKKLWGEGYNCRRTIEAMPKYTWWCGPFNHPPMDREMIDPYADIFSSFHDGQWVIDVEHGLAHKVDYGERSPFVGLGKIDPKEFRPATQSEIDSAENNYDIIRRENEIYQINSSMMASLANGDK